MDDRKLLETAPCSFQFWVVTANCGDATEINCYSLMKSIAYKFEDWLKMAVNAIFFPSLEDV